MADNTVLFRRRGIVDCRFPNNLNKSKHFGCGNRRVARIVERQKEDSYVRSHIQSKLHRDIRLRSLGAIYGVADVCSNHSLTFCEPRRVVYATKRTNDRRLGEKHDGRAEQNCNHE